MHPLKLARLALEAEKLRLQGMAGRMVRRLVMAAAALLFVIGTLVFIHIGAWYAIRMLADMSVFATAGILGGADLLIALVLLGLASRSGPSATEREALDLRRRAVQGLNSSFTLMQLALPALRMVQRTRRRSRG
ncbi:MAG: hypothetical protein B7Z80_02025 [Rhodospirillales bacterium 20-64-7]|nr:MAG: hypothetical protein B7Z80_02025 [Rhodospirillales bacterium 20-64-7]HQT75668.1 hypothetical protein [Rhodopila sp.]